MVNKIKNHSYEKGENSIVFNVIRYFKFFNFWLKEKELTIFIK